MKEYFFAILLLSSISCNTVNNNQGKNSTSELTSLKAELELVENDIFEDAKYWRELDSSVVACFKTDSSTVSRIVIRLGMKRDSLGNFIWIPENSPSWFRPSIDQKNQRNRTFIKELENRKTFLQFNQYDELCYFAHLKW